MSDKEREGLFYVCSLIEYVGRKTKNRRGDVVRAMSDETIRHQLAYAESTIPCRLIVCRTS